jgi:Fur family zinc uptake transcriptional regulator
MTSLPQLTNHQTLVLGTLSHLKVPTSAYALLDHLRAQGLRAPQQVYRALDKLIEYGLVHKLDSLNAFVACTHPHPHTHGLAAFAICTNCGQAEEIADPAIEKRLQGWSKDHAFKLESATIEMRGTCGQCAPGPV